MKRPATLEVAIRTAMISALGSAVAYSLGADPINCLLIAATFAALCMTVWVVARGRALKRRKIVDGSDPEDAEILERIGRHDQPKK